MSLTVQIEDAGEFEVLVLSGEVDLSTLPRFTDAVNRSVSQGHQVVAIDLEMITVLDDAALGIVLGVANRLRREHRELILICSNERITRYLESTGVASLITVVPALSLINIDRNS